MADTTISLQNPSVADTYLDAEGLTVGITAVKRERLQITGSAALEVARVLNAPAAATDYAVVTRPVGALADNTPFVDGTTPVLGAGFIFDDAAGTALTENDIGAARIDSKRSLMVTLEDATTRASKVRALGTIPAATDVALVVRPVGQLADNTAFTDGTTAVLPVGFIFDEAAGAALTENDVAAGRITANRAMVMSIEDSTTRGRRALVNASGSLLVDVEELPAPAALTDALGNPTTTLVGAVALQYNGATFERTTGPLEVTILSSAARTTTQTGSDQTNRNARGIAVVLDMTAVGTGSVTLTIEGKDPLSGKYVTLLAGIAVTTNSTNVYTVYPGYAATANVSANAALWRTWRVNVTANNANSATYSVGSILLL